MLPLRRHDLQGEKAKETEEVGGLMASIRPPIKCHGGKWYLFNWVISHFPKDYPTMEYGEVCIGGGSVFFNKKRSEREILSDVNPGVIAILKSLRDEPKEFIGLLKKLKYKQSTFDNALARSVEPFTDYVEHAVNEYALRRMSRGGMKKAFAWSERLRGGVPGDVNAWKTMIKQLPILAERLAGVHILQKDFLEVCKMWDESTTLLYIDPPYLPSTRSKGCTDIYDNEMPSEMHVKLLNFVKDSKAKIALSGYSSSLYNKYLKGWRTARKEIVNHSSQTTKKAKRMEMLWMNY
jgi:DNA adenine methylase